MKKLYILAGVFLFCIAIGAGCGSGSNAANSDNEESEEGGEIETADNEEAERATIFDPDWKAKKTHTDAQFTQLEGKLVEEKDGLPPGGAHALASFVSSVYAATDAGIYKISSGAKPERVEPWGSAKYGLLISSGGWLIAAEGVDIFVGLPGVAPEKITLPDGNVSRLRTSPMSMTEGAVVMADDGALLWLYKDQTVGYKFTKYEPLEAGVKIIDFCETESFAFALSDNGDVWLVRHPIVETPEKRLLKFTGDAEIASFTCRDFSDGVRKTQFLFATNKGIAEATLANSDIEKFNDFDYSIKPELTEGFPFTDLTFIKFDLKQLIGTREGLIALSYFDSVYNSGQAFLAYFHTRYFVPDWQINDAVIMDENTIFAATPKGVGIITKKDMTLADKAKILDDGMYTRHNRMGMFAGAHLTTPGDLSTHVSYDDDNDGEWTGMYLASQSFRYAATKDPEAYAHAKEAADAMLKLINITGKKGFFARSLVEGDKCPSKQCSGCGEWHLSADGKWCWKGDTSTDEYVGHIFGLSIFYDYAATDADKELVKQAFVDLHDGLIANGYTIQDIDGETTSDGHLEPEFINTFGLFGDAGLNGAMILGGLRAAYHMSGEQRFLDAFNYLAYEEGYAEHVSKIEEINLKTHTNHDSEEMSFLAMTTLMRYETEPTLMELWRKGMQYLWEVQIPEKNAEANMIYAYVMQDNMSPADGHLDDTIKTLMEWHLHGINWPVINSHRTDYTPNGNDRADHAQSKEVFPYYQKQAMRWAENPYRLDWEGEGNYEQLLTPYLLPYWMGRAMGVITDP